MRIKGDDHKYHILSQVDIIKFLYNSGQFNELFSKSIKDLPVMFEFKPKMVSITADTPAIIVCWVNNSAYRSLIICLGV